VLDGVTLDQLRTFVAAADQGSFSAAGRKLRRAQSVVSQTLANLEAQLGVKLFDRTERYPKLTDEGRSLLVDARSVADAIDGFKARARAMREGLEPELAVAVDVMYPMERLTKAASHSRKAPRSSSERAVTAWQPAARASPSKSVSGNCARSTGSPIGAKWWTSAP